MKTCKNCNNPLSNQKNTFCNSSCSASYNNIYRVPRTQESKVKTAKSVCNTLGIEYKEKIKRKPNPLIRATLSGHPYTPIQQCTYCKRFFDKNKRKSTTCSDECFISVKTKLNSRGKKCKYNDIIFDSEWEKRIAVFLDSKSIRWVRPKTSLVWIDKHNKKRKYFPDFYLPDSNVYLDPKNLHVQNLQQEKINYLQTNYDNIVIGTLDEVLAYLEGVEPSCNPITLSTGS